MIKGNAAIEPHILIEDRIERVTETGCWLWVGTWDDKGYGKIKMHSKRVMAHRLSYSTFKGSIPKGAFICHTCDTPACVNPDHLYAGTPGDNMRDKARRGRATRLPGESNPMCKLTDKQVLDIIADTRKQRDIAKDYGVSQSVVSRYKSGNLRDYLK